MRIVIADYSGHPFQVQLSRELARRGHSVLHLYFAGFQTPKGRLSKSADDPQALEIEPISLGAPFEKHQFIKRRFQEVKVGKEFAERIARFAPDVVVASNLPLDALRHVQKSTAASHRAFVFWQQDIYSIAIGRILRARIGVVGALVGKIYKAIEGNVLRRSQAVIAISEDFVPYLYREFGVRNERIYVVRNWAPLDEIKPGGKNNAWAIANGFAAKKVVLYTGTLGYKHDPGLILALAERLKELGNAEVVVASEGPAADWLKENAYARGISTLRVIGFQPYEDYSDVLATADVLICILEPDAGVFSVPSKVLSYFCAGRAIVLSAPTENLASRTLLSSNAGIVAQPGNSKSFVDAVVSLLGDRERARWAGDAGRQYAEKTFDIRIIVDDFEAILTTAQQAMQRASDLG